MSLLNFISSSKESSERKDLTEPLWDMVIIGGGGAGLTAALYAGRARLKTLVIEKEATGGALMTTDDIENYPGFPDGIPGPELTELMEKQAKRFGAEIAYCEVNSVEKQAKHIKLDTTVGDITAKTLILAVGSEHRKLQVKGEEEFAGRGVSYCATCDGAFFRDKEIVVVGGGDSALKEALFLTRYAKKVYIVHRREELRAEKIAQERAFANDKIEFIWNSVVEEIGGEQLVSHVNLRNVKTDELTTKKIEGVFIFVGMIPRTAFIKDFVDLDESDLIKVNMRMQTNIEGIWAAGDVRSGSDRQLATAVGEGCTAAIDAMEYVEKMSDAS